MLVRLLLTFALLLPIQTLAEDFGQGSWGDSLDAVRQAETRANRTPLGEEGYLIYEASLPDIHYTRLVYQFEGGQLSRGRFLFQPAPDSVTQAWIEQFRRVRELITRQYGEPSATEALTPDAAAEPDPADWAEALTNDRLILKTRWQTERTELVQQLAWNGGRPHHQVIYRPRVELESDGDGGTETPF